MGPDEKSFYILGRRTHNCYYHFMQRLLKPAVQKRAEEIKQLILKDQPFEQQLGTLYTDLRLAGKHAWAVEVYQLLLLYIPPRHKQKLFHPALLQAFLSLGHTAPAQQMVQQLLKQNPSDQETRKLSTGLRMRAEHTLPPYTPMASLSKYAQDGSCAAHKKRPENLPETWQKSFQHITPAKLQEIGYFAKRRQLARTPQTYRTALIQTFDELACCYLMKHYHAVAALSGAMLEILLALLIHKKCKVKKIACSGKKPQALFDLHLNELITICSEKALLCAATLKLLRAARMQRNFIHPGKELLQRSKLTPAGARVCFLAVLEVTDELFAPSNGK